MATIELAFQPEGTPLVRIDAPEGGAIVDLCDDAVLRDLAAPHRDTAPHHPAAPRLVFSCRSANCGTCRVEVLGPGSLLEPPDADEARGLRELGAGPYVRLACRARVRADSGVLRLVALGPSAPRT